MKWIICVLLFLLKRFSLNGIVTHKRLKIQLIAPDEAGFRQYVGDLIATHRSTAKVTTHLSQKMDSGAVPTFEFLDPIFFSPIRTRLDAKMLADRVMSESPDLVHIHHEYGFWGSKTPSKYQFPCFVAEVRAYSQEVRITATAHTVIDQGFSYPVKGRGIQAPFRAAANTFLLPFLKAYWSKWSWGILDGVTAHSKTQLPSLRKSGCKITKSIPHYIPHPLRPHLPNPNSKQILVFGYFTPEKGQDLIIEALKYTKTNVNLILAGGLRRNEDQLFYDHCKMLISNHPKKEKITVTGYLNFNELDKICDESALAVLPFRATSGSGSLADLFTRSMPVLASDLTLNQEINDRIPNSLALFKSESPESCANSIDKLIENPEEIKVLSQNAERYAQEFGPEPIAQMFETFFHEVLNQNSTYRVSDRPEKTPNIPSNPIEGSKL